MIVLSVTTRNLRRSSIGWDGRGSSVRRWCVRDRLHIAALGFEAVGIVTEPVPSGSAAGAGAGAGGYAFLSGGWHRGARCSCTCARRSSARAPRCGRSCVACAAAAAACFEAQAASPPPPVLRTGQPAAATRRGRRRRRRRRLRGRRWRRSSSSCGGGVADRLPARREVQARCGPICGRRPCEGMCAYHGCDRHEDV